MWRMPHCKSPGSSTTMAGDDMALSITRELCSNGGWWRDRRCVADRLGALQQWQAATWQMACCRSPESFIVMVCKRFFFSLLACLLSPWRAKDFFFPFSLVYYLLGARFCSSYVVHVRSSYSGLAKRFAFFASPLYTLLFFFASSSFFAQKLWKKNGFGV
jgi:hypothetical protein